MAEYTLIPFDQSKVTTYPTLGYQKDGKVIASSSYEFYDLERHYFWGQIKFENDPNLYKFTTEGKFTLDEVNYIGQLYILETTITKTTGTKIARVTDSDGSSNARPISRTSVASEASAQEQYDTEEIFSIATLQPREEIAMQCLQSMLTKYDNPLNIDNTKIKQLVSKSFLFAQEFINQSVLYREKETTASTTESTKYASVDSDSLSSDTDKLLYNISTALTNWMAQNKNQYADQQKNGLKVSTTDINVKTTFPETINANISGSVKAEVSGQITTHQQTTE